MSLGRGGYVTIVADFPVERFNPSELAKISGIKCASRKSTRRTLDYIAGRSFFGLNAMQRTLKHHCSAEFKVLRLQVIT